LSSASMAASESEFSISSSKSASPGAAAPSSPLFPTLPRSGAPERGRPRGRGGRGWRLRQHGGATGSGPGPGCPDRLAVRPDRRRGYGLAIGTGIGRFEVDDVAQQDFALVELVAPNNDGLKGERAFAQPGDHRFATSLDTLRDGNLAFAREQLHRAHFAQ